MKLEDIIKQEQEIEKIRKDAINKISELKEIGIKLSVLQERKWESLQLECMNEAEIFFENGNFKVERNEKSIIAKHEDIEISVKNDSEDELLIFQINIDPIGIYNAIEIRPCDEDDDMFYQKNNLKIDGKDIDFNNYIELVNKCREKSNLSILLKKVEENIIHYKDTIEKFDQIKYIYTLYKTDIECNSFKEVFENHIN